MTTDHFSGIVHAFAQLRLIPVLISTDADYRLWLQHSLAEPPECPFVSELFSCDANGDLIALNLTAPSLPPTDALALDLHAIIPVSRSAAAVPKVLIRNFVGSIRTFSSSNVHLTIADSIILNASTPYCFFDLSTCKFLVAYYLTSNSSMFFNNVTLLHDPTTVDAPASTFQPDFDTAPRECEFVNLTMPCPVPRWLARCFNVTNVASVPCFARTNGSNPSAAFRLVPNVCDPPRKDDICSLTCSPPPQAGFSCDVHNFVGGYGAGYFPATPGFATIEFVMRFVGIAFTLTTQSRVRGIVTRIEVWDWRALNWSVIDYGVPDRVTVANVFQVDVILPPVISNRIRITLEQWFSASEAIIRLEWKRLMFGARPDARIYVPPKLCALAESYSARSMLDETVGDSYCIGRLCQFACQFADNFTFDRSVVPQFVVIEGGALWNGAPLEAMPSDDTRVYRYNASSQPISALNLTTLSGVKRVRLIGDPVIGEPLPLPKLPSKRGMPGIFVKRLLRSLPSGFAKNVTAEPSQCQAVLPNGTFSTAVVANVTFVFTDAGDLLRCAMDDDNWINETDAARLTKLTVNSGAPAPLRRLVGVDDRLLMVVSAYTVLHDGSVQRHLVNRVAISSAIDVLDVASDSWFNNLLQHDIGGNITDIDVAAHQNGSFAVVAQESGAAMVFEWRPYPYKLIECGDNRDCRSCLSNEANDEMCRWCGSRCASLKVICVGNETSTINLSMCEQLTTTTTTTTTTTKSTTKPMSTTATTEIGGDSETSMDSTVASLSIGISATSSSADPFIPLYAVLGVVGGLAVIGAIGALVWKSRRRSHSAAESPSAEQRNKENQDDIAMQRYSAFGADGAEGEAMDRPPGNYDDSSVLQ